MIFFEDENKEEEDFYCGNQTARQNWTGEARLFVTFQIVPGSVLVAAGTHAVALVEPCRT